MHINMIIWCIFIYHMHIHLYLVIVYITYISWSSGQMSSLSIAEPSDGTKAGAPLFLVGQFFLRSWRIQGSRDPPRRDLQTPRLSAKAVERRSGISILLISCPIGMATDSAGWTIVKSYAHKHGAVLFLLFSLSRVCVQFHLIPGYSRNLAIAFHVHFLLAFNYL